jgi:hypothetical protein
MRSHYVHKNFLIGAAMQEAWRTVLKNFSNPEGLVSITSLPVVASTFLKL